mgnify:CR=1 FL=1
MLRNKIFISSILCAVMNPFSSVASVDKVGKYYGRIDGGFGQATTSQGVQSTSYKATSYSGTYSGRYSGIFSVFFGPGGIPTDIYDVTEQTSKATPKSFTLISIGAGYYLSNSTRAELIFTHFLDKTSVTKTSTYVNTRTNAVSKLVTAQGKRDRNVNNISLKVLQDIYSYDKASVFVSSGVGISSITTTYNTKYNYTSPISSSKYYGEIRHKHSKSDISASIGSGVSYDISENMAIELAYNFNYFGSSPKSAYFKKQLITAHAATLGFKLDM